jgi:hypothetical protein
MPLPRSGEIRIVGEDVMRRYDVLKRVTVIAMAIASAVLVASASRAAQPCTENTDPRVNCDCTLAALKPLQGAVGLGEVSKKTQDIADDEKKETQDLADDPIKVVRGPDNALFVVDHHHGARAWLNASKTTGTCVIQDVLPTKVEDFRAELKKRNWVRLKNEEGKDITWDQLPAKLTDLPDDPYRTLAWMVRKEDGFCRALMTPPPPPPFVEFIWADFFRSSTDSGLTRAKVAAATDPVLWDKKKTKKKDREAAQKDVLDAVLAATGSSGQNLPGWNKPDAKGEYPKCAPDPPNVNGVGG